MNDVEAVAAGQMARAQGSAYDQPPVADAERRMHAQAYDYWVSLLQGRAFPLIESLDRAKLGTFGGHSVLFRLRGIDGGAASIEFVGDALAEEADVPARQPVIANVPSASLLGELVRRLPAIAARRSPMGFEADHRGPNGEPTLFRGVLLPFADADGSLDHVLGVINWKRVAVPLADPSIASAVRTALAMAPLTPTASAWGTDAPPLPPQTPEARLAAARTWAALAATDRTRAGTSMMAALSAAYDLLLAMEEDAASCPAELAAMPAKGGTVGRVLAFVFGLDVGAGERLRLRRVLRHARRLGLGTAMLGATLERHEGGIEGFAADARHAELEARHADRLEQKRAALAAEPAIGEITLSPIDTDYLLLLARRGRPGQAEVLGRVPEGGELVAAAMRRYAVG